MFWRDPATTGSGSPAFAKTRMRMNGFFKEASNERNTMKARKCLIAAVLFGMVVLGPGVREARADFEVSGGVSIHATADFVAPLTPVGTWVDVHHYGHCFRPTGIGADWRPYADGQWVWTDCGWYWESDEPWAWACYHYGSWVDDPAEGWLWVPDIDWAPAWVEWRYGGGFVGWAPCAPHGVTVEQSLFTFVDVAHFHDPLRRADLVFNSPRIFDRTSRLAEPRRETRVFDGREQKVFVDHGPDVAVIQRAGGHAFTQVRVHDEVTRTLERRDRTI